MTIPLVSQTNGLDMRFRGDERTRTAASVPTTQTDKRLQARRETVAALMRRDGDRCFYCEQTFPAYHLDHVQPGSRGGGDHLANRVLACGDCNLAKRDWPAWLHVFYAGLGLTLPPNTYRVNFGRYPKPWYCLAVLARAGSQHEGSVPRKPRARAALEATDDR